MGQSIGCFIFVEGQGEGGCHTIAKREKQRPRKRHTLDLKRGHPPPPQKKNQPVVKRAAKKTSTQKQEKEKKRGFRTSGQKGNQKKKEHIHTKKKKKRQMTDDNQPAGQIIESFDSAVPFVQSIYDRIPKPELSREEARSYLRRLERLKGTCLDKLKTAIFYPSPKEQVASAPLKNYVVVPDGPENVGIQTRIVAAGGTVNFTNAKLEEKVQNQILYKRANAVIIFTAEACRVKDSSKIIPDEHMEILFVLAVSRDIAVFALNTLIGKADLSIFAEVPKTWDEYFQGAGFTKHPYESFGTLLPKHSFLQTWVLNAPLKGKPVNAVFEATSSEELKFPADTESKELEIPSTKASLFINDEAYPKDNASAKARFSEDYTLLLNMARMSNGQVELEDAKSVRVVLQRMFAFARNTNKPDTWRMMIEVERAFADFGVLADPSTQSMYNDLIRRNNTTEQLANLWVMRNFASMFPRFAPQQISLEANTLQRAMKTSAERTESRTWIVANLTQASDFAALNPFSFATIKALALRMQDLRQSWEDRVKNLSRSIAVLGNQVQVDESKSSSDSANVAPIVALQKKAAEILKTARDVEVEFQRAVRSFQKQPAHPVDKAQHLTMDDWVLKSEQNSRRLQTLTFDATSVGATTNATQVPAPKATALVASLVAASQKENAVASNDTSSVNGVNLETAGPDNDALKKLMYTFNTNLTQLQNLEMARKREIREKMTKLAANALGAKAGLAKLAKIEHPDLSTKSEQERTDILERARGCEMQLQLSIVNPIFNENDEAKEAQISEQDLIQLHNTLISQEQCMSRYYQAMQILEQRIKQESETTTVAATRTALQEVLGYKQKADIAILEAKAIVERTKSASFKTDTENLTADIATMTAHRLEITQMMQRLEDGLQPSKSALGKEVRNEIVQSAKNLLTEIVTIRLNLGNRIVTETEQFRLLSAMHMNQKNLQKAEMDAAQSARVAAETKAQLELEYATKHALKDKFTVATSNHRHATASFSKLQEMKDEAISRHKIGIMQLAQQLQMDLDQKPLSVATIERDIQKIGSFFKKHNFDFDREDFADEKQTVARLVTQAQQVIEQRRRHQNDERSDWENKQQKMKKINTLMTDLQDAVSNEDEDEVEDIAEQLDDLDYTSVYTPGPDARKLIHKANRLVGSAMIEV